MLQRLRRLKISLAAKCQLLFGSAVVLIIAAALFVPWQRMEQVMRAVDERTAAALADQLVYAHLHHPVPSPPIAASDDPAATSPSTTPAIVTGATITAAPSVAAPAADQQLLRLLGLGHRRDDFTTFERRAMGQFVRQAEPGKLLNQSKSETFDELAGLGFRYVRPVVSDASCIACHAPAADAPRGTLAPLRAAATMPAATQSAANPSAAAAADEPFTFTPGQFVGIASVEIPSQLDRSQVLLNRVLLGAAGLLAGSLAVIVFYLITTRLILQPVRVLQETAQKVALGDLNIRSDINTGDEFQQLSETFNAMLISLQGSAEQLRTVNKGLDLRLVQLSASNSALDESNQLKSEFLANVSHELRTPLNSILGFTELLKEGLRADDGKSARYVQNILASGRNLLDLINDLLDLAKIEAGKMEVRAEPISLPDLFEGLASLLKPLTEARQLTIATSVEPDLPILQTDSAKLQQILYNLLSNAIKFSPAGGKIDLAASLKDADRVRVTVTDAGPGVDPGMQQAIFEKFRQLDGSVTRQHSGTGLGLAISRELTGLLRGTIGVTSTPGRGAMFWVELPIKIEAGPRDVRGGIAAAPAD